MWIGEYVRQKVRAQLWRLLRRIFRFFFPPSEAQLHFEEGLRYHDPRKKEFDQGLALYHFREAVRLEPNKAKYHLGLAHAYVGTPFLAVTHGVKVDFKLIESAHLAIAECKEALRLKPNYWEVYLDLAMAYRVLGEKDKALEALRAVLKFPVDKKITHFVEASIWALENKGPEKPRYQEARKHMKQAISYRGQGKYMEAEKELGQAVKLVPDLKWLYETACELGK